jgi:hypothetical protein
LPSALAPFPLPLEDGLAPGVQFTRITRSTTLDKPMRALSERPILFNAEMVRAILAGTKTQTRRPVLEDLGNRGEPVGSHVLYFRPGEQDPTRWCGCDGLGSLGWVRCPFGVPASRLWVRETFLACGDGRFDYRADSTDGPARWTPSIHMPRAASRLTLEVTAVRVERLLSISESDVRAEGVKIYVTDEGCPPGKVSPAIRITGKHAPSDYMPADQASWTEADYYRGEYLALWDDIYGRTAPSKSSPWVWAIEFRRVEVSDGR